MHLLGVAAFHQLSLTAAQQELHRDISVDEPALLAQPAQTWQSSTSVPLKGLCGRQEMLPTPASAAAFLRNSSIPTDFTGKGAIEEWGLHPKCCLGCKGPVLEMEFQRMVWLSHYLLCRVIPPC